MIAVLFELWPAEGQAARYLDLAAGLKAELESMDGFLSIERFESMADPGKLLSLSFWRDEDSVASWRNQASHRAVQASGRSGLFVDYRLRVAQVLRDYGLADRTEAPADSRAAHRG
jgi:heme-degrading monooxygenase HmoA